jgi:hypothetical protein
MEGYLEIFGRKFCGKKGNFGLWRRKLFFGEWKHWFWYKLFKANPTYIPGSAFTLTGAIFACNCWY